ncbi:MAG: Asp-tRNA(Asn)/Glu-tRNA(Gln) amidotransferase subunit GatC [Planctomycetota bacterium]|nr:Asp-tRNA(Asn)/Glu-tRNA(Gln) amidotransferase subunit GatC [Planctomycetota bacterium]MDI6788719.1 Asp-tRNA(Asn)/Glu-tRNA(Gln) amidotransferase subunit GatC [Planctomycetota bacterium]
MEINDKLIEHISFLARLSLSDSEKGRLKTDLTEILSYVERLKVIDVSNIEPLVHSLGDKPDSNIWREDRVRSNALFSSEKALQNAPNRRGNFFEVPRVIE